MYNLLNNLPDELIFTIISYVNDKLDITNLIDSSEQLKVKFNNSNIWIQMLYQNMPDIKSSKDIYIKLKDNLQIINLSSFDYLILRTGYTERLHATEIGKIMGDLQEWAPSDLAFITEWSEYPNYIVSWSNPNHMKALNIFLNINNKDIELGGCVGFYSNILNIDTTEEILSDIQYCRGIGIRLSMSSFTIADINFLYIEEDTYE
jgi:hypothetical protein